MIPAMFISLAVLLLLTVPVGVILLIITVVPNLLNPSFAVNIEYLARNLPEAFNNTTLLAIPLFMLSGVIMAKGQISKKIYDVFAFFIGNLPGGLPSAVVVTCLFYGAISGSGPATTAAVGAMTIPMLIGLGYDVTFCASLVAVAGGLGVIIPPSVPFIMYSNSSGVSVGAIFIAGVLPGILIGALLILYVYFYCKSKGEDKEKIQVKVKELRSIGFWKVFKDSFWALLCPVIVLGGIYAGIVTPTEAACVSVVYALIVSCFIYRSINLKDMIAVFQEASATIASVVIITGAAAMFAKTITLLRIPQEVAVMLGDAASNKIVMLLIINLVLLICGMLLDTGASVLIMTPILLPLATAVGMDPIHFGVMMIVNLAIGFVTPPVGMNLYVAASLTNLKPMAIARKAIPQLAMFFVALMLITFIPAISLALI